MKIIRWLDDNLEEALLIALLVTMTLLMGLQVFSRYILNASLSWSEELTRYLFIWSGFLSISYCIKKWISIIGVLLALFVNLRFQKLAGK